MYAKRHALMKSIFSLPIYLLYSAIIFIFFIFTKYHTNLQESSLLNNSLTFFFYYFLSLTIYCHSMTMLTDPGTVEEKKVNLLKLQYKEFPNEENVLNFCKKCKIFRPERSHHCKTCNRCVLKLDQHCPWVFNCIGLKNQKFYYLMLFYGILTNFIALVSFTIIMFNYDLYPKNECIDGKFLLDVYEMLEFLGKLIKNEIFIILVQVYCSVSEGIHVSFGILICSGMLISMSVYFAIQTKLLSENKTWIEDIKMKKGQNSPFGYQSIIGNISSVLGSYSFIWWFIPIFEIDSDNDGYNYVKINQITKSKVSSPRGKFLSPKKVFLKPMNLMVSDFEIEKISFSLGLKE